MTVEMDESSPRRVQILQMQLQYTKQPDDHRQACDFHSNRIYLWLSTNRKSNLIITNVHLPFWLHHPMHSLPRYHPIYSFSTVHSSIPINNPVTIKNLKEIPIRPLSVASRFKYFCWWQLFGKEKTKNFKKVQIVTCF